MGWVFEIQFKDCLIQNNPFLKLWVTHQKCLQKILWYSVSSLDFQGLLLLLLNPPLANRKRRKCSRTPGPVGLLHSWDGRGDFTSRNNIPGKLPTFPPPLVPKATVPSGVPSAVFTVHQGHHHFGGGGQREGRVCRMCETFSLLLLTFNYLNPCCLTLVSFVGPSLSSSSSRNLYNLKSIKQILQKRGKGSCFISYSVPTGEITLRLCSSRFVSLLQLFILWAWRKSIISHNLNLKVILSTVYTVLYFVMYTHIQSSYNYFKNKFIS